MQHLWPRLSCDTAWIRPIALSSCLGPDATVCQEGCSQGSIRYMLGSGCRRLPNSTPVSIPAPQMGKLSPASPQNFFSMSPRAGSSEVGVGGCQWSGRAEHSASTFYLHFFSYWEDECCHPHSPEHVGASLFFSLLPYWCLG